MDPDFGPWGKKIKKNSRRQNKYIFYFFEKNIHNYKNICPIFFSTEGEQLPRWT
jgi:hypothetical protein